MNEYDYDEEIGWIGFVIVIGVFLAGMIIITWGILT